ncbi:MAG: UDP-N-acetylglucosamine 1-carboxyvinyltransferase [Deltaproteobacteria bacterium]|nr:UDP-N-acetylglucosamine 1-carboxyvinyltransferase [Deltaproteobacteria bacterium]
MDRLVIRGGVPLQGEVRISGSKNAVLPAMAAALLAPGESRVRNVPNLMDVRTMVRLLEHMGVVASIEGDVVRLDAGPAANPEAPYELVKTMRASFFVLGPLLARYKRARVSLPGGCAIGARPVNLHLVGLQAMGAEIDLMQGYVEARADKLHGATIAFDQVTVGGTENVLMAATLAAGTTVIENAAAEPEVEELARLLNRMGARVRGAGTRRIVIEGVGELSPFDHAVIPDRIEAGTFLAAAVATRGDVVLVGAALEHLEAVVRKFREMGAIVDPVASGLRVRAPQRLEAVDVSTAPYPGFPTDMQAQIMACLALARGRGLVTETIFENRYMHVFELVRLGADIAVDGRVAMVRGGEALDGAPVMATDLRASASLVVAGLAARGTTEVRRVYHIDRGYERIENKLLGLGARIERVHADGE